MKMMEENIMLYKAKALKGYKLHGLDGELGEVREFYFDDHRWTIRYLIAETGNWLADRQVLISPHALAEVNTQEKYICVNLTKNQIENSPSLANDKPVSRQYEAEYYGYFGYPAYWEGSNMVGVYPYIMRDLEKRKKSAQAKKAWDPHLRSTQDVSGHVIHASDGEIGHVDDFIIDDGTWAIRYLIIATRNLWPGKKVLISPAWIEDIIWESRTVYVNLLREMIRNAPEYTEETLLTRDYETGLHRHYNYQGYWVDEAVGKEKSILSNTRRAFAHASLPRV
jgi:hypothetical protein